MIANTCPYPKHYEVPHMAATKPPSEACIVDNISTPLESSSDTGKHTDHEKSANSSRDPSSAAPCSSQAEDVGEAGRSLVSFDNDDPDNPYTWTRPKKIFVVIACMLLVMNSTMGSSIAAGASEQTKQQFHIADDTLLVLPVSVYPIGYVIGPLVFAVSSTIRRQ